MGGLLMQYYGILHFSYIPSRFNSDALLHKSNLHTVRIRLPSSSSFPPAMKSLSKVDAAQHLYKFHWRS